LFSPLLLYNYKRYISPALFEHEKKQFLKALTLSSTLFVLGCRSRTTGMIPSAISSSCIHYYLARSHPFFSLDEFMSLVIVILLATGITFLLPVFMITLSFVGIAARLFGEGKWRQAFAL